MLQTLLTLLPWLPVGGIFILDTLLFVRTWRNCELQDENQSLRRELLHAQLRLSTEWFRASLAITPLLIGEPLPTYTLAFLKEYLLNLHLDDTIADDASKAFKRLVSMQHRAAEAQETASKPTHVDAKPTTGAPGAKDLAGAHYGRSLPIDGILSGDTALWLVNQRNILLSGCLPVICWLDSGKALKITLATEADEAATRSTTVATAQDNSNV